MGETMKELTAAEQYELVKGHPEVWDKTLAYIPASTKKLSEFAAWRYSDWEPLPDDISTLTLCALFMLAAECGVRKLKPSQLIDLKKPWCARVGDGQVLEATPLAAAVAAHKRRSKP